MSTTDNKALVLAWYQAELDQEHEKWAAMMHEDFRYYLPGNMPASGWRGRQEFIDGATQFKQYVSGPMTLKVGVMIAEAEWVSFVAETNIGFVDGNHYNNYYVNFIRIKDGKILELKEFSDTLYLYQAFDSPDTRGEPKARQSPIEDITVTLSSTPR